MAKPFKEMELQNPDFVQRLFKKIPAENAFIEVLNLLAQAADIIDVRVEDVGTILEKYPASVCKKLSTHFEDLLSSYVTYCLIDKQFSEEELERITHLKNILAVSDSQLNKIRQEATRKVYKKSVEETLSDGKLTDEEKVFLENLEKNLGLATSEARRIYQISANAYLQKRFDEAVVDERLSPEEDEQLQKLSKNLGLPLSSEKHTMEKLERYRLYWVIENGKIPAIEPDINLQKNESCHFAISVEYYEKRTVTRRIRYGGPTARVKIMKGVYWRMGDLGVQKVTEDVTSHIDSGNIYITSKRLIFMGSRKNSTIRLNKILDFTPYKNGIQIEKETGKSPIFLMEKNVDLFSLILARLLREI